MELEKVRELMEMLETSSLHKLQLKNGEEELVLEKAPPLQGAPLLTDASHQGMSVSPSSGAKHMGPPSSLSDEAVKVEESQKTANYTSVVAPLVGIYYESSSPESPPFVKVGSLVKEGDTLCIIEAMKVLNEIKAPVAGEIKAIHVKNGDVLSYDQILIEIGE